MKKSFLIVHMCATFFMITCNYEILSFDTRKHRAEDDVARHAGSIYAVGHQYYGWFTHFDNRVDLRFSQR